jgi:FG-GAP repeat protein
VSILLGDGLGGFREARGTALQAGAIPDSIVIADLNGDGHQDLAVTANGVEIFLGDGRGRFRAGLGSAVRVRDASALATEDFNGDGRGDLAVGNDGVTILLNAGPAAGEEAPEGMPVPARGEMPRLAPGASSAVIGAPAMAKLAGTSLPGTGLSLAALLLIGVVLFGSGVALRSE